VDTVRLAGADVLLLATAGNFNPSLAESIDIANDRADPTIEQTKGEVLIAEQAFLITGLGRHAQDASAAKTVDPVFHADLEVL
jgi:hypothetical protein